MDGFSIRILVKMSDTWSAPSDFIVISVITAIAPRVKGLKSRVTPVRA